jgi:hypothetical protein
MKIPRLATMVAISALVLGSGPTTIAAQPTPSSWLSGIRDSDTIQGRILIEGRLLDSDGQPVQGRLYVTAWPTQDVLSRLDVGDELKQTIVAKGQAHRDGSFVLRADPTVSISEFLEPSGIVNFDLVAQSGKHAKTFAFPRRLDSAVESTWVSPGASTTKAAPAPLSIDMVVDQPLPAPEGVLAPLPADKHFGCTDVVVATYNNRTTLTGEVYTGPDATGDFQYAVGGFSTLGQGWSVSGSFGSFSASGTRTVTAQSSIDYPTVANNGLKVMETQFQYKKIHHDLATDYGCVDYGYSVDPTAWEGDMLNYTAAAAPSATYCSSTLAGGTTTKDAGVAITFTNGVQIKSAIGADLSSSTGFNTSSKIVFKWQRAGHLCGSNSTWPNAARLVGKG